jgi:protease IV
MSSSEETPSAHQPDPPVASQESRPQPPAGQPAQGQPYGQPAYGQPHAQPAYGQPYGQPTYPAAPNAAAGVPPAYAYPNPPHELRTKRRWPWWVLGITVVLVVFGCVWASVAALMAEGPSGFADGDTIAVIPMTGTISGSASGSGAINPQGFLKLLQRAEDDSKVKAIVLRIDSPGGTVAASEEIASYVQHAKKPIVVSVADMDASGAYMVSARADKIIANPGSAVGSIGVIMEITNASRLLDKVGVEFKVITAGKYKDAGSPYRAVTPVETAMLQTQINEIYGQFIDIVADGRKLPRSEVESMATGWAWTGTEAKKMGLVDKVGTYEDALRVAADLGKIKGGYRTDVYSENELSGILSALLGVESMLQKMTMSPVGPAGSTQGSALAR